MTGIISTYAFIFFLSQLSAPPFGALPSAPAAGQLSAAPVASSVSGVSDGWKIDRDNTLTYIVQMSPQMATDIATRGEEIKIPIPTNLQGIAENVLIRIGNAPVERELTDDQLRTRQQQRARSDTRNAGITDLNSLSSRSSGSVVPIDAQRSPPAILPTGNTSAPTRSTENDLAMQVPFGAPPSLGSTRLGATTSETLPPSTLPTTQQTLPPTVPPSFAQPSMNSTNGLSNGVTNQITDGFNSLRNGLNQPANNSLVNPNGSYASTSAPPYTGGNVTVLGTPSIDRIASNPYGTNQTTTNPFGSTYGGANPYGNSNASSNWNNPAAYGQQPQLTSLNGQYGNQLNNQPLAQYPPGTVPMPSLQNGIGSNPWALDPRNASNAYTDPPLRGSSPNTSYLPTGYDNSSATLPPYARLAQSNNSLTGTSLRDNALTRELGLDAYGNAVTTRQGRDTLSGLGQLLLIISLIGNAYLLWQLSNLFNSYRTLQLSKRSEGSYSLDV
jgi:hypothetical protein